MQGGTFHRGQVCWTVAYMKPGASRTYRVRVRVSGDASARVTNRASADAKNAKAARASATVKAIARIGRRGGGVTG